MVTWNINWPKKVWLTPIYIWGPHVKQVFGCDQEKAFRANSIVRRWTQLLLYRPTPKVTLSLSLRPSIYTPCFLVFNFHEIWYTNVFWPKKEGNWKWSASDHLSGHFSYNTLFWQVVIRITVSCRVFKGAPWPTIGVLLVKCILIVNTSNEKFVCVVAFLNYGKRMSMLYFNALFSMKSTCKLKIFGLSRVPFQLGFYFW